MKDKRSMEWGKIALATSVVILLAAILVSCTEQAKFDAENARLDVSLNNIDICEIYYRPALKGSVAVDKQTGVMYWISQDGHATLLVDAKGRPRVWSGEGRRQK